eukprot:4171805-Prymnesium_polylepis.1
MLGRGRRRSTLGEVSSRNLVAIERCCRSSAMKSELWLCRMAGCQRHTSWKTLLPGSSPTPKTCHVAYSCLRGPAGWPMADDVARGRCRAIRGPAVPLAR